MTNNTNNVNAMKIEVSIEMLNKYVKDASIEPLKSILDLMKKEPGNEALLVQLSEAFGALGIVQGAVLTYAPYIAILVSDDPYGLKE